MVGAEIAKIKSNLYPVNQLFLPSVCHIFNTPWQGVKSLSFNGEAVTGDIKFTEGYHIGITPTPLGFLIKAGRNYGLPLGCGKVYPELNVPDDCASVVSTLNSVSAGGDGDFKLSGGSGVAVFNDKDNHRIYVGLNSSTGTLCTKPAQRVD